MRSTTQLWLILCLFVFAQTVTGQNKVSGIDHYLESGKTILVAKCKKVGPVNKLLRAIVEVEVIHVVKGLNLPATISVLSHIGMEEGNAYLLKSEDEFTPRTGSMSLTSTDSVVRIHENDDLAELLSLPPKIIVLRTMNLRIYRLENKLQVLNYELEALRAARKE